MKKFKNLPSENSFDFTEYIERQKEDEVDLDFFFELKERK